MTPPCAAKVALLVALLEAAAGSGCLSIDDRTLDVKVEPIALDDFEEMTAQPKDPRFGSWQSAAYNTEVFTVDGAVAGPGHNSNWCLGLQWQLTDPPNGKLDHAGVLQGSKVSGSIDLSRYTRIVFTHLYQNTGSCQPLRDVLVRVLCQKLGSAYEKALPVALAWQTNAVELAAFGEVASLGPKGVRREDCLAVADEIQFLAEPDDLEDGGCSSGDLFIDDISIR